MKTIATLLILFCGITFSNAQEKKLPNKEETKEYLSKMAIGNGKYSYGGSNLYDNKGFDYYSGTNPFDGYFGYTGEMYCYWTLPNGDPRDAFLKTIEQYSGIDYTKLKDVVLTSKVTSNATCLQVSIEFNDKKILHKRYPGRDVNTYGKNCTDKYLEEHLSSFYLYIPNEEGSFDRFKKALFHYKDLLIAEQKQKIADDPFAN